MSDSTQLVQRTADAIAVGAIPANVLLWITDIDHVLRIFVSVGSLILIGFAIVAKVKQWRKS